ncbi:MAG: transcription-repair coupling factor [Sphingomonadales bacterium]
MIDTATLIGHPGRLDLAQAPEGFDALALAAAARAAWQAQRPCPLLHVAREDARLASLESALAYFAPDVECIAFPAWDCLPYDRVSPNGELIARRMATLAHVLRAPQAGPRVLLTTVNAALQRVPPPDHVKAAMLDLAPGQRLDTDALIGFLRENGYIRSDTVTEPGEFAVRGGLVDLFPPGADNPVRVDFFGDEIDSLRRFDALDQRSIARLQSLVLVPAGELRFTEDSIRRFRQGYVAAFGAVTDEDPLYHAISEGRRAAGAEHWLPLFHARLVTLFDYVPADSIISLDHQAEEARAARQDMIADHYESRRLAREAGDTATPYKPLPPDNLYLTEDDWQSNLANRRVRAFTPFRLPQGPDVLNLGAAIGRDFAPERQAQDGNLYDALKQHLADLAKAGQRSLLMSYSEGARQRLAGVLEDHGIANRVLVENWREAQALRPGMVGLGVLALEHGFSFDDMALITEQDLLGDRLIRKSRKARRAENFIAEASALTPGDLVVHLDHGIGRYEGLVTITAGGAPHDCVWLTYAGGDKLYVPVENIEVLSRYGSEDTLASLDKLGGSAWQGRKARLKLRIREIADELIKIAAKRMMKDAPAALRPDGLYDEFCARFPFAETEDQARAIADVAEDLAAGRPMDRLVCGDVGFGKTEVALRAAFLAVMAGLQVAIIAPTTLLARQHEKTFRDRFRGFPVHIGALSRLVSAKDAAQVKAGLTSGDIDIVVGTHALLGKGIQFRNLGLLIVDEEQHFGVTHKERLKQLRANIHVLTLTATPIPRTLQMALAGIRDLSLIATPPVDRLAVRTFVMPFDELVLREALLREHYRGGQSFFVVPRIADLEEAGQFLRDHVGEVKFVIAHGQMPSGEIEDVMTAFYDGRYDVLLSTTIIESGLDIPNANTLIVHKADMFGLAQLYQLRGRVGRSKARAYAYLSVTPKKALTQAAQMRLEVLQSLDTLGAGFSIASHDMDIRGAGNLLGDEQSGHIREVGVELYQQMLEEAVAAARGDAGEAEDGGWSPQINLGAAVMIPESYVGDLNLRMALYRRIAELDDRAAIDALGAELIDRFGPLPEEVGHLLKIIEIKQLSKAAGIERIEAGAKGITVSFKDNRFANPAGLVAFLSKQSGTAKLRPDHKLVMLSRLDDLAGRMQAVLSLARGLAKAARLDAAA